MGRALIDAAEADHWGVAYRLANLLLRAGVPVGWTVEPCVAAGKPRARGTFLILDNREGSLMRGAGEAVHAAAREAGVEIAMVDGIDVAVLPLGVPRIAVYGGGGAPYNHASVFAELGFLVEFVDPLAIRQGALDDFDVLAMPGGGLYAMQGQLDPLGAEGCSEIARWVRRGGLYLGSCAGAFDAAIVSEAFLRACPHQRCLRLINARVWNSEDRWLGLDSPGVGVLQARVVRPDHPVMFNLPETFEIVHYNGPFFIPEAGAVEGASDATGLAVVAGATERFTPAEYFLRLSAYDGDATGTMVGRAAAASVYTIIAGALGQGRVVLFGSHPEFGTTLALDGFGPPALMLANAVLWHSASRPRREPRVSPRHAPIARPVGGGLTEARGRLKAIAAQVHGLAARSVDPPPTWLAEPVAMSTFGLGAPAVWRETLAALPGKIAELGGALDALGDRLAAVAARATDGLAADRETRGLAAVLEDARGIIHYRVPAEWRQDFGYEGLLRLLERCASMLDAAHDRWGEHLEPSDNPYAHFERSPYHLVAGSYLAASGVLMNALHLVRAVDASAAAALRVARLSEGGVEQHVERPRV